MTKEVLVKRIKSLAWRIGAMTFVAVATYILQIGNVFELDGYIIINTAAIVFLGLVVAEITKYLNK